MSKDPVWGAKATQEIFDMLDELFERSGYPTKKEYLEHLARLDKANNIRKGSDGSLPPELLKLSAGDLTELLAHTDSINKLYIRMIERSSVREGSLSNELARLSSEYTDNVQASKQQLDLTAKQLADSQHDREELIQKNELLQHENKLIEQERGQHAEALRMKEEVIVNLNSDIAEKYKRISELDERIQSFERLSQENIKLREDLREAHQNLKDQQKDSDMRVQSLLTDHKLALATETQIIRDAAQAEITKYRDELTAQLKLVVDRQETKEQQLRSEMESLRKTTTPERKPLGRPPKS